MTTIIENITLAWMGNFELLKQFVAKTLSFEEVWSQSGGERKIFTYGDSTMTWRKNKCLLSFMGEKSDEVKHKVCKQLLEINLTNAAQLPMSKSNMLSDVYVKINEWINVKNHQVKGAKSPKSLINDSVIGVK